MQGSKEFRDNLKLEIGDLVFRRIGKIVKGPVIEVRWYTGPGKYEVIQPRAFTENELNKHVEFHVTKYHFFTSAVTLRDDAWKGQTIFGSSFCHAEVDPISLKLTRTPTKILPHKGDLICGLVKGSANSGRAPNFTEWFICSEQALRAWTMIMYDNHKTFMDEPKLRRKMMSGNRLCTNTHLKWEEVHRQNNVSIDEEESKKTYFHLRTEFTSTGWVHIYAALVLMARYEELPTDENIPQNLAPNSLQMKEWNLPYDYVNRITSIF